MLGQVARERGFFKKPKPSSIIGLLLMSFFLLTNAIGCLLSPREREVEGYGRKRAILPKIFFLFLNVVVRVSKKKIKYNYI